MVKRFAINIARALKGGVKKVIIVATHPTQILKRDSKTQDVSRDVQITTVTHGEAIIIKDEVEQLKDDGARNALLEEPEPDFKVNGCDNIISVHPTEDQASLKHSERSIPVTIEREHIPTIEDHYPLPEGNDGTAGSTFTHADCDKTSRADSGAVLSPSATGGAVQDALSQDETPNTIDPAQATHKIITISHESDLARHLQQAVLEHRNLKVLEQDADAQLQFLEDQASTIAKQIDSLQHKIKDLSSSRVEAESSSQINALYDAISDLREAEADNWKRQQRLKRHMSELYQDFRDEQWALFDNLDIALVKTGLVPEETRSKAAEDIRPDDSTTAEISTATIKNDILDDYIKKRKRLGACEQRFDTKEDMFDALEESRMGHMAVGEEVETSTEFDFFLCEETRQMTRALIDAEAEYEVSKAAAVAAGIQLKYSDMESGFVDDVDDGYRISRERDMVENCDRGRIEDWLVDLDEKECPTRYLSVCEFGRMDILNEAAGLALREVDISDSRSMVAEGPSRKRIDRWVGQFPPLHR